MVPGIISNNTGVCTYFPIVLGKSDGLKRYSKELWTMVLASLHVLGSAPFPTTQMGTFEKEKRKITGGILYVFRCEWDIF